LQKNRREKERKKGASAKTHLPLGAQHAPGQSRSHGDGKTRTIYISCATIIIIIVIMLMMMMIIL